MKKTFRVFACLLSLVLLSGCVTSLVEAKAKVAEYYENGSFERDVARKLKEAEKLLPRRGAYNIIGSAVVFDIDDTALSTYEYQKGMGFGHYGVAWHQWLEMKRGKAIKPVLDFYNLARERGLTVFFVSGRREKFRRVTEENLRAVGFDGWKALYMKPDDFKSKSVVELKMAHRIAIEKQGYKIVMNIGDQPSDLEGGHAKHTVLLPNLIYGVR